MGITIYPTGLVVIQATTAELSDLAHAIELLAFCAIDSEEDPEKVARIEGMKAALQYIKQAGQ